MKILPTNQSSPPFANFHSEGASQESDNEPRNAVPENNPAGGGGGGPFQAYTYALSPAQLFRAIEAARRQQPVLGQEYRVISIRVRQVAVHINPPQNNAADNPSQN